MTKSQTLDQIQALLDEQDAATASLYAQIEAIETRYAERAQALADAWALSQAQRQPGDRVRMRLLSMSGKRVVRFGEIAGVKAYCYPQYKPPLRFDYLVKVFDGHGRPTYEEYVAPGLIKKV